MDIGRMNERITLQKTSVEVDGIGNHRNVWEDYFTCWAYASTYEADESGDEVITEEKSVTFCCRHCSELAAVNSINYRILFHGDIYNILSIDRMNYQRQEIRLRCRKEAR